MLGIVGASSILGGMALGTGVSYLWLKRSAQSKFAHLELAAKAKAKAMEHEAEMLLKAANIKIKENEIEQESAFQKRVAKVDERNRELILKNKEFSKKEEALQLLENRVLEKENALEKLETQKQKSIDESIEKMQNVASLTREEAKAYI